HHGQEQEEHPRKDGDQEVRSRRPQARDLQGRQDQVTDGPRAQRVAAGSHPRESGDPEKPAARRVSAFLAPPSARQKMAPPYEGGRGSRTGFVRPLHLGAPLTSSPTHTTQAKKRVGKMPTRIHF